MKLSMTYIMYQTCSS